MKKLTEVERKNATKKNEHELQKQKLVSVTVPRIRPSAGILSLVFLVTPGDRTDISLKTKLTDARFYIFAFRN